MLFSVENEGEVEFGALEDNWDSESYAGKTDLDVQRLVLSVRPNLIPLERGSACQRVLIEAR